MTGSLRSAIGSVQAGTAGCVAALLAGCASPTPNVAHGTAAFSTLERSQPSAEAASRIMPADKLNVYVLYEKDLSREALRVAAGGTIDMPLVGQVEAAGLTTAELSTAIEHKLTRYLKHPQVDITIVAASSEHVIVEGQVNQPGVYDIAGSAGLLEALAQAKSTTRTAALNQVVVFRQADGQRIAAVFDVARIRRGADPDPRLYAGDTVVVGFSEIKGVFRDFLTAAPVIAIFKRY